MATATLTSKGQLTLPAEVRAKLRLKAGDQVRFDPLEDGGYRLVAKTGDLRDLYAIVPKPERPVTLEDMDDAIANGIVSRFDRSRY